MIAPWSVAQYDIIQELYMCVVQFGVVNVEFPDWYNLSFRGISITPEHS